MKKLFFAGALSLSLALPGILSAAPKVHVDGYTRKDGTYVRPHDRNAPGKGSSKPVYIPPPSLTSPAPTQPIYTPPAYTPPVEPQPPKGPETIYDYLFVSFDTSHPESIEAFLDEYNGLTFRTLFTTPQRTLEQESQLARLIAKAATCRVRLLQLANQSIRSDREEYEYTTLSQQVMAHPGLKSTVAATSSPGLNELTGIHLPDNYEPVEPVPAPRLPPPATSLATQENAKITTYFSPNGGAQNAVVQAINRAKNIIQIQAYSFTSAPIVMALINARKRGLQVSVILDKANTISPYNSAAILKNAHIPTYIDGKHAAAHNNILIIDRYSIITGSFNFSSAAEEKNANNMLVLTNCPALLKAYDQNFEQHRLYSVSY